MARVMAMASAIPMSAAARRPTMRINTALTRRATARVVTSPRVLEPGLRDRAGRVQDGLGSVAAGPDPA